MKVTETEKAGLLAAVDADEIAVSMGMCATDADPEERAQGRVLHTERTPRPGLNDHRRPRLGRSINRRSKSEKVKTPNAKTRKRKRPRRASTPHE